MTSSFPQWHKWNACINVCVQKERGEVISNYKWYFTCDDTKLQKQQPQNDDGEEGEETTT